MKNYKLYIFLSYFFIYQLDGSQKNFKLDNSFNGVDSLEYSYNHNFKSASYGVMDYMICGTIVSYMFYHIYQIIIANRARTKIKLYIKRIMLKNKKEINQLLYTYPGIISFYKDVANDVYVLQYNNTEAMNIKKIFYSIIYEIIKKIKISHDFSSIKNLLVEYNILLEGVVKEILLCDEVFLQNLL